MRTAMLLGLAMAAMIAGGCGGGGGAVDEPLPPTPWFATAVQLSDDDGVATDAFWSGETITVTIAVTNLTDRAQTMRFAASPFLDYEIRCLDGCLVWRWSETVGRSDALVDVAFAPGETRRWFVRWNQADRDGWAVRPGTYDAAAFIPALLGDAIVDHGPAARFGIFAVPAG
jgi:hypothetical protein